MATICQTKREDYKKQLTEKYSQLSSEDADKLIDYLISLAELELKCNKLRNEKAICDFNGARVQ